MRLFNTLTELTEDAQTSPIKSTHKLVNGQTRSMTTYVVRGLILIAVLTATNCSNHKRPEERLHSLDSSGSQSNKVNSIKLFNPLEFRHQANGEFDVIPNGLKSDKREEVKEILISIKVSDQSIRDSLHKALDKYGDYSSEAVRQCVKRMKSVDSVNQVVLTSIFQKYGWPSIQIFGEQASDAPYLVLIHSDLRFQMKYIGVFEAAVKKKEANPLSYAILVDRILRGQGKKQMYGTHGFLDAQSNKVLLFPIENEGQVNKRRAELGLSKIAFNKCDMLINF